MQEYLNIRLGWLIDPENKRVEASPTGVQTSASAAHHFVGEDVLQVSVLDLKGIL